MSELNAHADLPARVVVGAAIVHRGRLLAQQRAYPLHLAGRWELPGGQVEPGESDVEAVVRECHEELGASVTVGAQVGPDVPLQGGRTLLRVYEATLASEDAVPTPHEHQAVAWVSPVELTDLDWLDADRVLLPDLRALLDSAPA
ncbi:(deoxy)nucleoside triphosphate pyrophosphohydrolase [Actinopolymorpha alba]|uniref:(deoxy)nucleoside triphosphate pyrophosphohydrolase n=1 Tax=Actinopolymorpha alba TaxID=533267 RepID=UPI00039AB134|nr:(deoxy)nucleoside triphosphate pyrophosphohydrolase [Actinopolymorpha alba]